MSTRAEKIEQQRADLGRLFLLTFWIVCIPGLILGGIGGGVLGTIMAGGPALNQSVIDLQNTWKAKDGTTQWANPGGR